MINEERVIKDLEKVKEDKKNLDFFKLQIEEAKKLGKEKFDKKRFRLIPKKE